MCGLQRRKGAAVAASFLVFSLASLAGCSKPEKKITYTTNPQALQSLNQPPVNNVAGAPAGVARPNDPMNDPDLARRGQDILQRTGGDVNKMTEKEKATFFEAAKNGHL